ncbi:hypothetical protein [Pedobacter paludis]|uniref:Uncharacterized protein n=1 Tax=Pedobacter paludis TaxID=2203212 RepID=A0A317F0H4_9SPHI|nr:hypothetical protein [Pedobacter paludis]PWS30976.1 hypothetical protein DF947_15355 [Pedobacter paludis]
METLTIKIPDEKSTIVKQILKEFGVTILDATSQILNLSPEQQEEIISSQEQVKNGLFVEQSTLDDEVKEWLKK